MEARARRNPLPQSHLRSERGLPSEHDNVLKSTPI
jgi:hypothetical protein